MASLDWPTSPPVLTDGHVTLRSFAPHDAGAVFAACQDPDIQRWTTVPVPYLEEHARGFVTDYASSQWTKRAGAPFAVVSADDDRLLGSCGLVSVDADALVGEVGYWIAPRARGQKVAQRAARLLCDWALGDGGLARVELLVEPDNLASCAVAEQIGCEREGVLRSRMVLRGVRRDTVMYALLRPDATRRPERAPLRARPERRDTPTA